MTIQDLSKVRSQADFSTLTTEQDKSNFIHYQIYGSYDGSTPNYYTSLVDVTILEKFIWTHRPNISRPYVLKLSGTLSNRVYKTFSENHDNTEVALNFYFALMHCDLKDRLSTLVEVLCKALEAEDSVEE